MAIHLSSWVMVFLLVPLLGLVSFECSAIAKNKKVPFFRQPGSEAKEKQPQQPPACNKEGGVTRVFTCPDNRTPLARYVCRNGVEVREDLINRDQCPVVLHNCGEPEGGWQSGRTYVLGSDIQVEAEAHQQDTYTFFCFNLDPSDRANGRSARLITNLTLDGNGHSITQILPANSTWEDELAEDRHYLSHVGGVYVGCNTENITIRNVSFRNLTSGIDVRDRHGGQDGDPCLNNISIRNNTFENFSRAILISPATPGTTIEISDNRACTSVFEEIYANLADGEGEEDQPPYTHGFKCQHESNAPVSGTGNLFKDPVACANGWPQEAVHYNRCE